MAKIVLLLALSFILSSFMLARNWKVDNANSKVEFEIAGSFATTVKGTLSGLKATINFDESNLEGSNFIASVDVKTVFTDQSLRDKHIAEKEVWFDVEKFPTISFFSKKIEKTSTGYNAIGDLKIKNIAQSITIPFTFVGNSNGGVFKGSFNIDRTMYRVGKRSFLVGSNVAVSLTIAVTK
jgi:polyisoprenoid-binding protein YceI